MSPTPTPGWVLTERIRTGALHPRAAPLGSGSVVPNVVPPIPLLPPLLAQDLDLSSATRAWLSPRRRAARTRWEPARGATLQACAPRQSRQRFGICSRKSLFQQFERGMRQRGPNPHVPQAMKDLCSAELPQHATTQGSPDPLPGAGPTLGEVPSSSLLQERRPSIPKGFQGELGHGLQLALSKSISLERCLLCRAGSGRQTRSSLLPSSSSPSPKNRNL